MIRFRHGLMCSALALTSAMAWSGPSLAQQQPAPAATSPAAAEEILVIGRRINRSSMGATGLPLSLMETPQAVTLITRDFIEDFGLDEVNEVLKLAPGVRVEQVETDRTYYLSRGFELKSMQVDGVGLPFNWNVVGDLDTVIYDKVEVIRGANGMLTGTGNPSGTINYVRKRPLNELSAYGEVTVGSWEKRRLEGDVSFPLSDSSLWAARVVAATQKNESHLNLHENDRTMVYGVVEGQVGDSLIVTLGYSEQDAEDDGVLWGALPLVHTDGTQTDYPTSTTTSMDWTYWNTHDRTGFVELTYALPGDWEVKGVATYNDFSSDSALFYVYGTPDRATGQGLFGWPGQYWDDSERLLVDVTATGSFSLFDRRHTVLLGANLSWLDQVSHEAVPPGDDPAWGALPAFPGWRGDEIPRPAFLPRTEEANWETDQRRIYGATQLNLLDGLNVILGFNWIDVETDGVSYDESMDSTAKEFSPYVGFTYALLDNLNLYASYSDIFEPQSELDVDNRLLGPAEGRSYEAGLKGEWLDGQLFTALTWFKAEQENYAESAGFDPATGRTYYAGREYQSDGIELEVSGRITNALWIGGGLAHLTIEDQEGKAARKFVPKTDASVHVRYEVIEGLTLGGTIAWQDDIETGSGSFRQEAFTRVSAFASYQLTDNAEVAVNVNNLTDEKYVESLFWDQSFYAPPRNVSVRLRARY